MAEDVLEVREVSTGAVFWNPYLSKVVLFWKTFLSCTIMRNLIRNRAT